MSLVLEIFNMSERKPFSNPYRPWKQPHPIIGMLETPGAQLEQQGDQVPATSIPLKRCLLKPFTKHRVEKTCAVIWGGCQNIT